LTKNGKQAFDAATPRSEAERQRRRRELRGRLKNEPFSVKDAAKACGQDHQRGSAEPEELITQHLDDHRGSAIHQQHFSYAGLLEKH